MIAAIAMSALSVGALLEIALAAAIRARISSRAGRRRHTTAAGATASRGTGASVMVAAGGRPQR
jgi:hypothetical protein